MENRVAIINYSLMNVKQKNNLKKKHNNNKIHLKEKKTKLNERKILLQITKNIRVDIFIYFDEYDEYT